MPVSTLYGGQASDMGHDNTVESETKVERTNKTEAMVSARKLDSNQDQALCTGAGKIPVGQEALQQTREFTGNVIIIEQFQTRYTDTW